MDQQPNSSMSSAPWRHRVPQRSHLESDQDPFGESAPIDLDHVTKTLPPTATGAKPIDFLNGYQELRFETKLRGDVEHDVNEQNKDDALELCDILYSFLTDTSKTVSLPQYVKEPCRSLASIIDRKNKSAAPQEITCVYTQFHYYTIWLAFYATGLLYKAWSEHGENKHEFRRHDTWYKDEALVRDHKRRELYARIEQLLVDMEETLTTAGEPPTLPMKKKHSRLYETVKHLRYVAKDWETVMGRRFVHPLALQLELDNKTTEEVSPEPGLKKRKLIREPTLKSREEEGSPTPGETFGMEE